MEAWSLHEGDAWAKRLVEHGVAATLGPTDEPYLSSFPDPAAFLVELFSCPGSLAGSPNSLDSSQFCDPRIDQQMGRAQAERLSDPTASRALWQRVDREITDAAPWVPLIASKNVSVLSKRVGNYQYSPVAVAMLLDQLWVR